MCKEICILVSHSNWWVLQVKIIGILIAWGASSWVLILSMVARLSCSSRKTTGSRWHLCTLPVHWQKLSKLKNRTLRQENVLPWTPFLQLVFANNNWNAFCCAVRKAFLFPRWVWRPPAHLWPFRRGAGGHGSLYKFGIACRPWTPFQYTMDIFVCVYKCVYMYVYNKNN